MVNILGKSSYVTFTKLAALWAWAWVSATIAPITWPTHVTWKTQNSSEWGGVGAFLNIFEIKLRRWSNLQKWVKRSYVRDDQEKSKKIQLCVDFSSLTLANT